MHNSKEHEKKKIKAVKSEIIISFNFQFHVHVILPSTPIPFFTCIFYIVAIHPEAFPGTYKSYWLVTPFWHFVNLHRSIIIPFIYG